MTNDVLRDSIEWAFTAISNNWPLFLFPFVLSLTVSCFKTLCGLTGRRRVEKKVLCRASGRPAADPVPSVDPVLASDRLYICSGCDDCPMLLKREKCGLSGTGFCCIGKWITKGGKIV